MSIQTITTRCKVHVGIDPDTGMVFGLTACCQATGKGSNVGVICRKCYMPVSHLFGDVAVAPNWAEVHRLVADLIGRSRLHPCPCPDECTIFTMSQIEDALAPIPAAAATN